MCVLGSLFSQFDYIHLGLITQCGMTNVSDLPQEGASSVSMVGKSGNDS